MRAKTLIAQFLILLIPVIYLLIIWNSLPERVPLHYNADMIADSYGSKAEMAGVLGFMSGIGFLISVLVLFVNRIDPKQKGKPLNPLTIKISWALTIFMTVISVWVVYMTSRYTVMGKSEFQLKYLVALIALLYIVLGNYMNNIKPNFFVGIRTPWTLSDDDIWKKTHRLGSRIWFYGGLLIFVAVLLLPNAYANIAMIAGTVLLAIIPVAYSYKLYSAKRG